MVLAWLATAAAASFCSRPLPAHHAHPIGRPRAVVLATSATTVGAEPIDAFHAWMSSESCGVLNTAHVMGGHVDGFGRCLVASQALKPGQPVLAVPRRLHLTAKTAEDEKASALGPIMKAAGVTDESVLLAMVLLEQVSLGEASPWHAYVGVLPSVEEMSLPMLWSEAERADLLRGSHLQGCVGALLEDLQGQWARIETSIASQPERFPPAVFRFEGFLWANAIVLSRALPFADSLALIPMLDFANHVAGSANTCSIRVSDGAAGRQEAWQPDELAGESEALLTVGVPHEEGEQVFIDYGEAGWRSSWEMLYTYGFVPGAEPSDWIGAGGRPLCFDGVQQDDPLHEQKVAALVALGGDEEVAYAQWVDVKADPAQSTEMAPLLRLAHLGREEEGAAATGAEAPAAGAGADGDAGGAVASLVSRMGRWEVGPTDVWGAMQAPLSDANERCVAMQVVGACDEALQELPSGAEIAEQLAAGTAAAAAGGDGARRGERMLLAARVLAGERHALEGCRQRWKGVLDGAD